MHVQNPSVTLLLQVNFFNRVSRVLMSRNKLAYNRFIGQWDWHFGVVWKRKVQRCIFTLEACIQFMDWCVYNRVDQAFVTQFLQ